MKPEEQKARYFTKELVAWHKTVNDRSLPWKNEKDPYRIWLSEILLQQTRALQGLPYYLRFTEDYPNVKKLAQANEEEVYRLWQGLGYYNRCKNLLATAKYISDELNGVFPDTYEGLLLLKGIGPYTAAAIASFAYGSPHAVTDGNVYRVLARYLGIETPYDTTEGKKLFAQNADRLLNKKDSGSYNQAIMDLGATVCTPANPKCPECPVSKYCVALHEGLTELLPVRSKKTTVKNRYFHYLLLHTGDKLWIHKRTGKGIWENLYEPLLIENSEKLNAKALLVHPEFAALRTVALPEYKGTVKQRLTHQLIETHFFSIRYENELDIASKDGKWVKITALKKYAFPKTVLSFLENNFYF
ncbi:MAG: A/G-specific adenine glycosylase [Taibaiella sp.]|nr:A/G-specific adenine glycosylase [Taibaiella sp.]